jgi:excisionase family DNA binding protein
MLADMEAATPSPPGQRGMSMIDDENLRAAKARQGSPFLSTAQAAFYVGLSRRTLEKMRTQGGGPKYRKHGRYVRYHIDDLDAWSTGRAKRSTSDA